MVYVVWLIDKEVEVGQETIVLSCLVEMEKVGYWGLVDQHCIRKERKNMAHFWFNLRCVMWSGLSGQWAKVRETNRGRERCWANKKLVVMTGSSLDKRKNHFMKYDISRNKYLVQLVVMRGSSLDKKKKIVSWNMTFLEKNISFVPKSKIKKPLVPFWNPIIVPNCEWGSNLWGWVVWFYA